MARVFLSHSSKDKEFVRELFRRLTRDGVNCFFDEESIEWGTNFILSLEQGIDTCEFFVAVLSPDFVQSKWVELERTSAIADDPAGLKRKMRPLLLQPCELPRFLRQIQQFDVSTQVLFEKNYPKICAGLGGTVRADPELPSDRDKLPAVTPLPSRNRMLQTNCWGRYGEGTKGCRQYMHRRLLMRLKTSVSQDYADQMRQEPQSLLHHFIEPRIFPNSE